ncbi:MAG: glutathione S-transferase family protein [Deltaproteobacteria bacterium]|nr:glutathione S-transferase family protein [Deltaproteobacteria bacterium]
MRVLRVYGSLESGNCYKVRLLLRQLGREYEWIEIDILKGESRTPAFLAMNPNGRVPLLEYAPGKHLAESNAILNYLADGTPLLPADPETRARILQWMFFEQYSHEPFIATSRFYLHFLKQPDKYRQALEEKSGPGYGALDVMENHLRRSDYLVAGRYSIADIALYAYTHVAHEGGFDLGRYQAIPAWLDRVKRQPGTIGITEI